MCWKLFISITLLISWFLSLVFIPQGQVGATVIIMMVPAIVAVILQMVRTRSIKVVLKPFTKRINIKAVGFTFLFPVLIIILCSILSLVTGVGKLNVSFLELLIRGLCYIGASIPFAIITLGEEYGWRGFLLPELEKEYGLKKANTKVGIIWMLFHLPAVFFINLPSGIGNAILFTIIQLACVFFFNYALTYLYSLSQNVILASIMHSVWNNFNTLILGDAYRQTSNGLIFGNVKIINGEQIFGMIFLGIFAAIIARKLFKETNTKLTNK